MGKFKTEKSAEHATLVKAKAMAEAFAKDKTKGFLTNFINDSGLAEILVDKDVDKHDINFWMEQLQVQMDQAFGGQICLAYAMGYLDATQGKTLKTLYVPGPKEIA